MLKMGKKGSHALHVTVKTNQIVKAHAQTSSIRDSSCFKLFVSWLAECDTSNGKTVHIQQDA